MHGKPFTVINKKFMHLTLLVSGQDASGDNSLVTEHWP